VLSWDYRLDADCKVGDSLISLPPDGIAQD